MVYLAALAAVQGVVLIALWADPDAGTGGEVIAASTDARDAAIHPVAAAAAEHDPQRVYAERVRPLLETHCFKCHGEVKPKGGVNLAAFDAVKDIRRNRKLFHRAWELLLTREMPPSDKPQPSDDERAALTDFFERELARLDCDGPKDPGRVVVRRLTRFEYANTVRDLLGVEYTPGDEFPMDDVGYGFDNIGDVMSLPPLLMEKYLAAADEVLGKVVGTRSPESWSQRVLAVELKDGDGHRADDEGRWFYSNSEAHTTIRFPDKGAYLIRVHASGDHAGGAHPRMAVRIDGKTVREFDVTAPRREPARYEFRASVEPGERRVAVAFTNDYYNPEARNPRDRDRNLAVAYLEVIGPVDRPPAPPSEASEMVFIASPGEGTAPRDAARAIVERFAARAFRRPVTAHEVDRLLKLYDLASSSGEGFDSSVRLALSAVLASPHFLFRVEADPADARRDVSIVAVDEHALATRLSYFLWSTMPDEQLSELARAGKLSDPDTLHSQIKRMLADPRSRALAENFALQWLQLRTLDDVTPDTELYPGFDAKLRDAMRDEVVLFFEAVVREDRPITELLHADFTFVNEALARHYEIAGVKGDHMQRVTLRDERRGGLLTMAAPLTVTSHARRTSPVKRGKWVLEAILGTPPPPPAPEAGELDDTVPVSADLTLRQRLEQHRADANCAICHNRIDPLGFAFEHFDPVGRWRDQADAKPIDDAGVLTDGREVIGAGGLKRVLLQDRDAFARALAEKMMTYALGRGLEHYDDCAIKDVTDALARDDYRFSSMVVAIVESLPFRYRRATAMQNTELTEQ